MPELQALESGVESSKFHVVTIEDENGNEIEAQLNIVLTDEGVVFDLYDRNGDVLLKTGFAFAQDIVDDGMVR